MNFELNKTNIIIGTILVLISGIIGYKVIQSTPKDEKSSEPQIVIKEDNIINEYLEKEFSKVLKVFSNEVKKSAQSMVKFNDQFLLKNDYLNFRNSLYTKDIEKQYILVDTRNLCHCAETYSYEINFISDTHNKTGGYGIFKNVIGFTYERSSLDNDYEINRYDGGFVPLFKDVFTFNSKFKFSKNDIKSLDLSNTQFNIEIDSFLKISNFSHIKISDTKILDLENDEEFEPKYETTGEIAIGRSDYDLFMSNWDFGFHYDYLTKTDKKPVSGTLRIEEDNSFISKIISLRSDIEIEKYSIDLVDSVESINLDNYEIVYQENDNNIFGKVNLTNAITSYLLSDGISAKFVEFLKVDPKYIGNFETIEDYVKEYIKLNITKLYEITEIEFYSKEDKTLDEGSTRSNQNKIEFEFLNDTERFEQGYKLNRNTEINKLDRFTLTFKIAKAVNSGTLVSPKIKIKFI